jgi:hypothetical protein
MRRAFLLLAALIAVAVPVGAQEQDRRAVLDRVYDEVVAARAALQQAEAAREQGIEPLEGERLGTVSGRSRLAPVYWERQERLENEVSLARKRLDDAFARLRSLK